MELSLSIILPVHNTQQTLAATVARVLDTAEELTEAFEILIVDDGSSDRTMEIAHELATRFRQVRLLRHGRRGGIAAALRTGLSNSIGEIVCVHEGEGPVDVADLRKLWQMRDERDLVLARRSVRSDTQYAGKRGRRRGAMSMSDVKSGFHMLRRDAIAALQQATALDANSHEVRFRNDVPSGAQRDRPQPPNFLTRLRDFALEE